MILLHQRGERENRAPWLSGQARCNAYAKALLGLMRAKCADLGRIGRGSASIGVALLAALGRFGPELFQFVLGGAVIGGGAGAG